MINVAELFIQWKYISIYDFRIKKICLFRGKSRDLSIIVNGIDCWFYQTKSFTSYCIYLLFVLAPNLTTEALDQENQKIKKNQNWLWINKWLNVKIYAQPSMERGRSDSWQKNRKCFGYDLRSKIMFLNFCNDKQYLISVLDWPSKLDAFDTSWK